jgi:hypothetical protein
VNRILPITGQAKLGIDNRIPSGHTVVRMSGIQNRFSLTRAASKNVMRFKSQIRVLRRASSPFLLGFNEKHYR